VLTGWHPEFTLRRELDDHERAHALEYSEEEHFSPDDAIGMIRFNSVYMEFVDRTFKVKGMLSTLVSVLGSLLLVCMFALSSAHVAGNAQLGALGKSVFIFLFGVVCLGVPWLLWRSVLRKDIFQYTHYPIRFNRKTGKIHFFRHQGLGGVVTLRWGDPSVYFHIGRGEQNGRLRDLRCHVLDGDRKVQQTLTVGHFWDHENSVREEWELIRRYMEEGPDKCFDHPGDRVITLSTSMTWRNCWLMVCLMAGTNLYPWRWSLLFPLYGGLTLSRWLTMKTCRKPAFPPEIEAECSIDPGDRYRLPEPSFMAEFAEDQMIYDRSVQRFRERQQWR